MSIISSPHELEIRGLFEAPEPTLLPHLRIRHLGAFWPHWSLHKRKCDATGIDIMSTFRPDCTYPIWHKDEWFKNANPPKATFDFNQPFFPQAEKLFKQCPIPHNTGLNNENCEYTDDWWHSRNCYLSHSGVRCEGSRYSYRILDCKDLLYCDFSFECERCIDIINSEKSYECVYWLYLKNCHNTAFCYDCRSCSDCLFCFNLRNKKYCIGNKQLTKEEYIAQKKQFKYDTQGGYEHCKNLFKKMMHDMAWHRSHYVDFCEKSSGNYLLRMRNTTNAFFGNESEDGHNITRFGWVKTGCDSINLQDVERVFFSSGVQIKCYDVQYSFMVDNTRFSLYSGYSSRCDNIVGCCGLLGAKNAVLNTSYSAQEFSTLKQKVIDHMKSTGEWGQFFPGSFAPNPYDESWSGFHFPLTQEEQTELGYVWAERKEAANAAYEDPSTLPPASEATADITKKVFWDAVSHKPFQILALDIQVCRDLEVALPYTHYIRRLQENFAWMPYDGILRETICAKSGIPIHTSWPSEYDGRILCEDEYLKIVN